MYRSGLYGPAERQTEQQEKNLVKQYRIVVVLI